MFGIKLKHLQNIFVCFAINIMWLVFIGVFFSWLYHIPCTGLIHKLKIVPQVSDNDDLTAQSSFFYYCISAPLWEEAVYRWAPIVLAQKIGKECVVPVVFAMSAIFGIGHGALYNIWIQGFFGLTSSYLFIKNNNSYWSSVVLHFMQNFILVYGLSIIAS